MRLVSFLALRASPEVPSRRTSPNLIEGLRFRLLFYFILLEFWVQRFGVEGGGFGVAVCGLRVEDLGVGVEGLGLRVEGEGV